MATQLSICNLALGEVPHKSIASVDEASLAAARCAEQYPQALGELIEAHDWEFRRRRVALAAVGNDRPGEWAFAYALPADCATPRRIVAPQDGAGFGTVGQMPAQTAYGFGGDPCSIPFEIAAGIIYTGQAGALLDYTPPCQRC